MRSDRYLTAGPLHMALWTISCVIGFCNLQSKVDQMKHKVILSTLTHTHTHNVCGCVFNSSMYAHQVWRGYPGRYCGVQSLVKYQETNQIVSIGCIPQKNCASSAVCIRLQMKNMIEHQPSLYLSHLQLQGRTFLVRFAFIPPILHVRRRLPTSLRKRTRVLI